MLKNFISLSIAIILSFSGTAQQVFYKHLEGKIGNSITVVFDIIAAGNKLSGYYYYHFADHSGDTSWTYYGKSMPISGTITSEGRFEFSEFNPEVKGSVFRGEMNDGVIHGIWLSGDGAKQLPFEAIENYPPGTMAFNVIYLWDETTLFDKKKSPVATIELSVLLPAEYSDQAAADSVKAFIYGDFFHGSSLQEEPLTLLHKSRQLYFSNYRSSNEDIYQDGASSFDWMKVKETRILHNEHNILSLEVYDYGFTGGAHGLPISKFQVTDLISGTRITLDDLFRKDYQNDLRDIINIAARNKYRLERNQSLKDAGFYSEFIDPADNFYMTRDGIGFYYNQYEVAPFAMGPVNIFISYRNLLRIIKTDSMIYRLITAK